MHLLIVDNHDSFTFNLVDYVRRVTGTEPTVVPNDTPWAQVDLALYDAAIISPGPGTPANPADLGISADVLREFAGPILGVCLGLQAMVHLEGGVVGPAPPLHTAWLTTLTMTGLACSRALKTRIEWCATTPWSLTKSLNASRSPPPVAPLMRPTTLP